LAVGICQLYSVSELTLHSLRFSGHFPGGPGLASTRSPFWILLELRMMMVVVTTGAVRHTKLQSKLTINKPTPSFFTGRQPTVSMHWRDVNLLMSVCT